MGRHHARLYAQVDGAELVGVVDADPQRRSIVVEEYGGVACATVEELLALGVEAVTVAVPTVHHRRVAEPLLSAGVACLIEKPLAPDVAEARAIADLADRSGSVLQVGHVVRYDPVMVAIRALPGVVPRFVEVDRISPMTFRSVDVGVVLDMMIHDIDLLLMLVGREPDEVHASAVGVLGEAEDVCNARLVFRPRGGAPECVANVTASRLALKTERKIRVIGEELYVSADFVARTGTVVRKTANAERLSDLRRRLRDGEDLSGLDFRELVTIDALEVGSDEPLRRQLDEFLAAVRGERRPQVDAEAGFAAVRTAERIVAAAGSGRV